MLLLVYGLVGLATSSTSLVAFLLIGSILNLIGHQLFVFSVNATPVLDAAMILAILYCFLSLMLAGFFVKWHEMPYFWVVLSYVTPSRYATGALIKEILKVRTSRSIRKQRHYKWSACLVQIEEQDNDSAICKMFGIFRQY